MIRVIAGILLMLIAATSSMDTEPLIVVLVFFLGLILAGQGTRKVRKNGSLL